MWEGKGNFDGRKQCSGKMVFFFTWLYYSTQDFSIPMDCSGGSSS